MKRLLALAVAAAFALAACNSSGASTAPSTAASAAPASAPAASAAGAGGLVGIAMPTKSSARWIADGDNLVKSLTGLGYTTDLQYAEDDIPTQVSQVENMVTKGAKVLVIAAIDGTTLTDTLQKAADAGIKVFAYDRLIRNSPNVDYYAAFDNYKVGVAQAQSTRSSSSRIAASSSSSPVRPRSRIRSAPSAGAVRPPRHAWTTSSRRTMRTPGWTPCCPRTTASAGASSPR